MSSPESDRITDVLTLTLPFSELVARISGGPNLEYAVELLRPPLCTENNSQTESDPDSSISPLKGESLLRDIYLSQLDVLAAINLLSQAKAIAEYKGDIEGHIAYGPTTIWGDFDEVFTTLIDQCSKETRAKETKFPVIKDIT